MSSPEGPGLPLVARIYTQGRYRRASVDPNHHGEPLTSLHAAAEWRTKALLRQQMLEEVTSQRDSALAELASLRAAHDATKGGASHG